MINYVKILGLRLYILIFVLFSFFAWFITDYLNKDNLPLSCNWYYSLYDDEFYGKVFKKYIDRNDRSSKKIEFTTGGYITLPGLDSIYEEVKINDSIVKKANSSILKIYREEKEFATDFKFLCPD